MGELTIFKLQYEWYEGEHNEVLLAKDVDSKQFEDDILDARKFAQSIQGNEIKDGEYLGKGYRVNCLPEYYGQIVWFLITKRGYIECSYDERVSYDVDDASDKKIIITRAEQKTEWSELN